MRDVFRYNLIATNNHAILHIDNIFDLTKEWQPDVVPLQEVGRIVLNQNPYVVHQNYIIAKGADERAGRTTSKKLSKLGLIPLKWFVEVSFCTISSSLNACYSLLGLSLQKVLSYACIKSQIS